MTLNLLWSANNQSILVMNFHQDFTASMHRDFFQGETDGDLIYWPNHSKGCIDTKHNSHDSQCKDSQHYDRALLCRVSPISPYSYFHYAESCYPECRYAKCRGIFKGNSAVQTRKDTKCLYTWKHPWKEKEMEAFIISLFKWLPNCLFYNNKTRCLNGVRFLSNLFMSKWRF